MVLLLRDRFYRLSVRHQTGQHHGTAHLSIDVVAWRRDWTFDSLAQEEEGGKMTWLINGSDVAQPESADYTDFPFLVSYLR